jgi:glucose/arabinose dehydrogenase
LATSGSAFVAGAPWRQWDGALIVACLRTTQLLVLNLDAVGNVISQVTRELPGYEGFRLRSAVQGPDGSLYVTTSNGGSNDRILRVTPS